AFRGVATSRPRSSRWSSSCLVSSRSPVRFRSRARNDDTARRTRTSLLLGCLTAWSLWPWLASPQLLLRQAAAEGEQRPSGCRFRRHRGVAQQAARGPHKPDGAGSSPVSATNDPAL